MHHQMDYNGQILKWGSRGDFKATSGLPDSQLPKNQCTPDNGPIPEGFYKIFLGDHGLAKDDGRGMCALKPSWGIQSISSGKAAVSVPHIGLTGEKIEQEWSLLI
ncbi:hypothetical protein L3081_12905 [Colwellia sp. MSW7]|uniref:DUF5675 domain-containing protein n=1 Tax=Colwellia maritima TaxID=2912588 RepID=A0ABS9X1J1_9GAMM|nr:hypothetical protein [Colwellia maritima]MCI2284118.1 hypothetical protein [Colwellia maritima]